MPIFFLLSRINKHMNKRRQQSILAGERKFFRKGAWKLWAREKMRKWSSFWICFRRTGGMRRCCLNKTEDRCCCRCWRWQSMVIEGLLWALSHGRRQSAQQDSNLRAGLFAIIWVELAQSHILPLVWPKATFIKPFSLCTSLPCSPLAISMMHGSRPSSEYLRWGLKLFPAVPPSAKGAQQSHWVFYKLKQCPVVLFHGLNSLCIVCF